MVERGWEVPGYELCRLLGDGRLGEVWLAVELASGALVVLRKVCLPPGDVADLAQVEMDHVVRCLDVLEADNGLVLVMENVRGGSLERRRGLLTPGQVVTALAPVAAALSAAHARGLVHGRFSLSEVLLTTDGKPVLDGLGLQGPGSPEADVLALAGAGLELLTPGSVGPVREALLTAGEGDAQDLSTALLAACPAEPLRAPVVAPEPIQPRRRRRWPVAALLLAAAGMSVGQLRPAEPTPWASVLRSLDATREAAFARSDPGLLAEVYLPRSPALTADVDRLTALRSRSQVVRGLRHRFITVRATEPGPDRAELEVVAAVEAHEITGPRGHLVSAGPLVTQHLALVRTRAGWRVADAIT